MHYVQSPPPCFACRYMSFDHVEPFEDVFLLLTVLKPKNCFRLHSIPLYEPKYAQIYRSGRFFTTALLLVTVESPTTSGWTLTPSWRAVPPFAFAWAWGPWSPGPSEAWSRDVRKLWVKMDGWVGTGTDPIKSHQLGIFSRARVHQSVWLGHLQRS